MHTRRYAAVGVVLGLALPALATLVEATVRHGGLPLLAGLAAAQANPALWVVDTAPLVLAVVAAIAGRGQDRLLEAERAGREQLRSTAAELHATSQALLATVSSFSSTTAETAASVRETTATMGQLAQTATHAALTAETVVGVARSARQVADDGMATLKRSGGELLQLAEEVRALARSIEGLGGRMRDLFEMASVVNYVADRSRRLADSAGAELQRPGGPTAEAMAGVVAEMRNHADDARRAAQQVKATLAELHQAVQGATTAAELGSRRAEQGAQVAGGTGDAIRRLGTALSDSSDAARAIATVAQQQDHGIDQVLKAMNEIYLATQEAMASTQQVAGQARALHDLAEGLRRQVDGEPG